MGNFSNRSSRYRHQQRRNPPAHCCLVLTACEGQPYLGFNHSREKHQSIEICI